MIPVTCAKRPDCLKRVVLPALFALLDVAKTEVRSAMGVAMHVAVRCLGREAVLECAAGLPEDRRTRLRALIE